MCEGCDTLCIKCESMMEKCIKCDCICHCGTTCMCECATCEHDMKKEEEVIVNDKIMSKR